MDVMQAKKDGTLVTVAVIDVTSLLCESEDDLVRALFEEARDPGFAVPVEPEDPRGGFELVKLTDNPESIIAFGKFLEAHNYRVRDVEAA